MFGRELSSCDLLLIDSIDFDEFVMSCCVDKVEARPIIKTSLFVFNLIRNTVYMKAFKRHEK